jgi:hypothetical protein
VLVFVLAFSLAQVRVLRWLHERTASAAEPALALGAEP